MRQLAGIPFILWLGLLLVNPLNAAEPAGPRELVEQTTNQVFKIIEARRAELEKDHDLLFQLTNEIIVPHFDMISISKWVLARNWRTASKEQKLRFILAFRRMVVRTYGVSLLEYDGNTIEYLPLRDDPGKGDVTVRTEFIRPGKPAVAINYSMHLKENGWKVYDVSVDGVSIVATFRTSFADEIRQTSLDALIERIEDKNRQREESKS